MDKAREASEATRRAEQMSNRELYDALKNSSSQSSIERAANYREAEYRTGREERPSGGCFITTAVCDSFGKADDCYELTAFRNFRDKWLANQSDGKNLIAQYYEIAPKIVAKINQLPNAAETYKNIWTDYLSRCLKLIETGDNSRCKEIYVRMVNNLKAKFIG